MTKKNLREVLATMSMDDLLRSKWREETILTEIKRELETRDARAVDAACQLKEHATNV